jgi:hypothetical protein
MVSGFLAVSAKLTEGNKSKLIMLMSVRNSFFIFASFRDFIEVGIGIEIE